MVSIKSLKKWSPGISLFLLLTPLLVSCRVTNAPNPPSTTISPPASAIVAPITTVAISPTEVAWSKVIDAAKKEGKVNVYSYNMTGDIGIAVAKAFKQKYGIDVEILTGMATALNERILTEQRMKTVVADIQDSNSSNTGNLKDAGATVGSSELPALRQSGVWRVEPWASDPEKHIMIHTLAYYTSFINTDVVKASDEPKSFRELTQPKWRGKVIQTDPRIVSGSGNFFTTLLQRKLMDQETVRAIGTNNVNYVTTDQESRTGLIQGRYSLILMVSPGSFATALKEGITLPVKPLAFEEGTLVTNRAMTAIKGSPHPNAAKLLMDWLLTLEGQTVFLQAVGLPPVRSDVPDFTPPAMRFTPVKVIAPTLEEEKENLRMFRENYLAKLWGR